MLLYFPINSNFDYKKNDFCKRCIGGFVVFFFFFFFCSNIALCGGHLYFLRGMNIFYNHNAHAFFHILTALFALI